MDRVEILAQGLDYPEGVAYGSDGQVYASGGADQVHRIDPQTRAGAQVGSTGGWTLATSTPVTRSNEPCPACHPTAASRDIRPACPAAV